MTDSSEHKFKEMTLSETVAQASAQPRWRVAVPTETGELVEIIGLLQARQNSLTARKLLGTLSLAGPELD
jgi:hypothetical protein